MRPTRLLLLAALLTLAVFVPSVANGFTLDDTLAQSVTPTAQSAPGQANPVITGWRAPWAHFGERYWEGYENGSVLYRPVTMWSYALTYNLVGQWLPLELEAFPHHVINVLLHCFAVYLVWWMLRDLGQRDAVSAVCAGLFGVHALHSEVVAGIVGRADLFAFSFGLWGVLLFVRGRFKLTCLLLFLAFCSKESALAWAPFLPCYLLARRWLQDRTVSMGTVLAPQIKTVSIVCGIAIVAFVTLRWMATVDIVPNAGFSYEQNPLDHVGTGPRLYTAVSLLGYGLSKCLAPFWLYSLYGPGAVSLVESPIDAGFLAAFAALTAWLVAGLVLARRFPLLFLSAAVFLGFSFITSNVPMVIGTVFGERLYYAPSLGVCLLPALFLSRAGIGTGRVVLVLLGLWGLVASAVVIQRNAVWRDNETLFLTDADRLRTSADLQAKAGYTLMVEDPDLALEYFARAIEADEDIAGAWASIGRIHRARGALPQAEENYRRALQTRYVAVSGVENRTISDVIEVLRAKGDIRGAFEFCADTLDRKPDHYRSLLTFVDLGMELGEAGGVSLARVESAIEKGLRDFPTNPDLLLRRGIAAFGDDRKLRPGRDVLRVEADLEIARAAPLQMQQQPIVLAALEHLGDLYLARGDKANALAVYDDLLKLELPPGTKARVQESRRAAEKLRQ